MIELAGVTKRYGDMRAVDDVSFSLAAGESLALWGTNGAGKTTLLRCLLGVTRFEGTITVDGISVSGDGKDARRRIGYVPQIVPVFDLRVGEMIQLTARLRGADVRQGLDRLEEFGLGDTVKKPVASLSGGMKQKLALTLALLGDPPILLLDEPTANLDARSQEELIKRLLDLQRQGRTIVFTSHRWDEVRALADKVVVLEQGKCIATGTVDEVADTPGERVGLRVRLAPETIEPAVTLLGSHGFDASRNGHSILITVDGERKAEPLVLLAASSIPVTDFELEEQV
ncbi:MAG: ABC transporter ATP-binding protein [Thermomicrobiales bacterium]|nr:ABC transporter ATP-binding protein [Thermomicrobiales bacterium]